MSIWLRKCVVMWCALVALLCGAQWFSSVRAQEGPNLANIFVRARENARRSSCMNNLKQISLGMMQYVQDWDEVMPSARKWGDALQPYVKSTQLFHCPSVSGPKSFGYAFNSRLSGKGFQVLDKVNPAQMVTIYETTDLRWNAYGLGEKAAFRHLNGANYAFLDGHIKWFEKTQVPQLTFQLKK